MITLVGLIYKNNNSTPPIVSNLKSRSVQHHRGLNLARRYDRFFSSESINQGIMEDFDALWEKKGSIKKREPDCCL